MLIIPALGRLSQEAFEFKARLCYIAKPCLKQANKQTNFRNYTVKLLKRISPSQSNPNSNKNSVTVKFYHNPHSYNQVIKEILSKQKEKKLKRYKISLNVSLASFEFQSHLLTTEVNLYKIII
jgi:DNA-directed RNA polymerase subunit L